MFIWRTTLATRMANSIPAPAVFLALPGDPIVPWKQWLDGFEIYYLAGRFTEPAGADDPTSTKKALLRHLLGPEGQQ